MLESHTAACLTAAAVLERVAANPQVGLTTDDVRCRRVLNGPNELVAAAKASLAEKLLEKIREPLMLLLLSSAAVSVLTAQIDDAVSILIVSAGIDTLDLVSV